LQRIERHALVLEGQHDAMRLHAQFNGFVTQLPWYEGVLDAVHEHHLEQRFNLNAVRYGNGKLCGWVPGKAGGVTVLVNRAATARALRRLRARARRS
jgi:hypothetical protein